jgi:serpin B
MLQGMIVIGAPKTTVKTQEKKAGKTRKKKEAEKTQEKKGSGNDLALRLYRQLAKETEGNIFMSPLSIALALGMAYEGANDETRKQMETVLGFSNRPNTFTTLYEGIELNVANSMWLQKSLPIKAAFKDTVQNQYGATVTAVDFISATEAARKRINDWVESETHNKIKDLIPKGMLDDTTRLVLANAIYFKGKWASQFDPARTREDTFMCNSRETVQAPFMHQKGEFNHLDTPQCQIIELPYNDRDHADLNMLIILPKLSTDKSLGRKESLKAIDTALTRLEATLTVDLLNSWDSTFEDMDWINGEEVELYLPRFESTQEFSLKETFQAMGLTLPFSDAADFSGITDKEPLHIGEIAHKAYIKVNEEGTEAAAATACVMKCMAASRIPEFHADHPFLYLIRDRSGEILFMGRCVNPA